MRKLDLNVVLLVVVAVALLCSVSARVAYAADKTSIQYRLARKKTIHVDEEKTARSYEQSLKNLGCEVKLGGHGGHFDLTYRCPQWRRAEFDGHDAAHQWQNWLKKLGFETAHKH
jgi:hypothetical protein